MHALMPNNLSWSEYLLPVQGGPQESPCHRISLLLHMQHETQSREKPQAY